MDMEHARSWAFLITVVLGSLTTTIVGIITAIKVNKVSRKADEVSKKADEIHVVVNSAMTEARTKIDLLTSILGAKEIERVAAENARIKLAEEAARAVIQHAASLNPAVVVTPIGLPGVVPVALAPTVAPGIPAVVPGVPTVAEVTTPDGDDGPVIQLVGELKQKPPGKE